MEPEAPKAGDYIRAEHIAYVQRLAAAQRPKVGGTLSDLGHGAIDSDDEGWFRIKLGSNSGASYAWTEQVEAPAGAWTDGPRAGTTSTDPAKEPNGTTASLSGKVVRARRGDSGTLWFDFGAC